MLYHEAKMNSWLIHFCEAVNTTAVRSTGRAQPKDLRSKAFCVYYTPYFLKYQQFYLSWRNFFTSVGGILLPQLAEEKYITKKEDRARSNLLGFAVIAVKRRKYKRSILIASFDIKYIRMLTHYTVQLI